MFLMKPIYLTISIIICTLHSTGFAANATPKAKELEVVTQEDHISMVETKTAQGQDCQLTTLKGPSIRTISDIPDFVIFLTEKLLAQPLCIGESPTTKMEYTYKKLSIKYWFDAEIYRRLALIVASRYISTETTYDETTGKMTDRCIYYLPDGDEKNFAKEFSQECNAIIDQLRSNWTEYPVGKDGNPEWRRWQKEGGINNAVLINALLAKLGLHKQAFALWNWNPSTMSSSLCLWIKRTHVATFNKKFLTLFQANNV
jgi:hypothetical protein